MSRRRRRFLPQKSHANEDVALQITSMADIFTILLVFLLKSYSAGVVGVSPNRDVTLPAARGGDTAIEALKLEVSDNGITVEGKPVSKLSNFQFNPSELEANGASQSLEKALEQERKRQLLIASHNDEVKADPRIMILADQRTPYQTLKTVLASAAVHGYTDFKLVVVTEE